MSEKTTLRLYLADGFLHDHVVIRTNSRKIFEDEDVTTNSMTGLAEEIPPVDLGLPATRLEVAVKNRGIYFTGILFLRKGTHVPISLDNGKIIYSIEEEIGFG